MPGLHAVWVHPADLGFPNATPLMPRVWDTPVGRVATWYQHKASPDLSVIRSSFLWGTPQHLERRERQGYHRWKVVPEGGIVYEIKDGKYSTYEMSGYRDRPEVEFDAPLFRSVLPARVYVEAEFNPRFDDPRRAPVRIIPIARSEQGYPQVPREEYLEIVDRARKYLGGGERGPWFGRWYSPWAKYLGRLKRDMRHEFALPWRLHPILGYSVGLKQALEQGIPPNIRFVTYAEPTYRNISRLADLVGVRPSEVHTQMETNEFLQRVLYGIGLVAVHDLDQMMREHPQARVWFLGRDSDTIFAAFRQRYGDRVRYAPGFSRTFPYHDLRETVREMGINHEDIIVDTGFDGSCVRPFMRLGRAGYLISCPHEEIPSATQTVYRAIREGKEVPGDWGPERQRYEDINLSRIDLGMVASRAVVRAEHLDTIMDENGQLSGRMNISGVTYLSSDVPRPFEAIDLHQLTPNNLRAWLSAFEVFARAVEAGPRGRLVPVLWSPQASQQGRLGPTRQGAGSVYYRYPLTPEMAAKLKPQLEKWRQATAAHMTSQLQIRDAVREAAQQAISVLKWRKKR